MSISDEKIEEFCRSRYYLDFTEGIESGIWEPFEVYSEDHVESFIALDIKALKKFIKQNIKKEDWDGKSNQNNS